MLFEALRKYALFDGRSRRVEYWLFVLLTVLIYSGAALLDAAFNTEAFGIIAFLGLFIPTLSVTFRRLHDINLSGAWALLGVIPFGGVILLIMSLIDGTSGRNRYGDDPKGRSGI